ncbi:MAG: hypothetical protein ACKVX7_17095 [Planctomycetota bacterium]
MSERLTGERSAHPPRTHSDGGHLQFVLLAVGIGCIVVSLWNIPQHRETKSLEARLSATSAQIDQFKQETDEYERRTNALYHDPHYRRVIIRNATLQRPPNEQDIPTYQRYLEGQRVLGAPAPAR